MRELTDVHTEILAYCSDDFTDLSTIVNLMTNAGTTLTHLSMVELQDKVLRVLKDLLEADMVKAGDLDPTGIRLNHWALSTDETIDRIRKEWGNHLREGVPWPDPWEIVCFVSTIAGDQALAEGKKRNVISDAGSE